MRQLLSRIVALVMAAAPTALVARFTSERRFAIINHMSPEQAREWFRLEGLGVY